MNFSFHASALRTAGGAMQYTITINQLLLRKQPNMYVNAREILRSAHNIFCEEKPMRFNPDFKFFVCYYQNFYEMGEAIKRLEGL